MTQRVSRAAVVWCPDWAVVASFGDRHTQRSFAAAVTKHSQVVATNAAGRQAGVRVGMRVREAQLHCPTLELAAHDERQITRRFETVVSAVESRCAAVAVLAPGRVSVAAPGSFYGSEAAAAAVITEAVVGVGVHDVRIGVADDVFTATQAARDAQVQEWRIVPAGQAADYVAGLPVSRLEDQQLAQLLHRLGLRTLGQFAQLDVDQVATRFGASGLVAYRQAQGRSQLEAVERKPAPEFTCEQAFEPPLVRVEAVAFSAKQIAEKLVAQLAHHGMGATEVCIEVEDEQIPAQVFSRRTWRHSQFFTATDLLDRLRWQLHAKGGAVKSRIHPDGAGPDGADSGVGAPVARVRLIPTTVIALSVHAAGLFTATDTAQVERGVARVQALLGEQAVKKPALAPGRSPAQRQTMVAWQEPLPSPPEVALPWPGSIPPPAPSRVFATPISVDISGDNHQPVRLTSRGGVTAPPVMLQWQQRRWPIQAWAGPWPVNEAWWKGSSQLVARFQVVLVDGSAWLLRCAGTQWLIEAAYE